MKFLTWQNPEQLIVAQEFIKIFKILSCGIKGIKKFCKHSRTDMEALSRRVDLYYLLGILNSSMADQLLADQRGGDYHIYPEHIRNLPIPVPEKNTQESIGNIAKEILRRRETNADYSELEEQLNGLVAALYQ